jgi:hypothetical protein
MKWDGDETCDRPDFQQRPITSSTRVAPHPVRRGLKVINRGSALLDNRLNTSPSLHHSTTSTSAQPDPMTPEGARRGESSCAGGSPPRRTTEEDAWRQERSPSLPKLWSYHQGPQRRRQKKTNPKEKDPWAPPRGRPSTRCGGR